MGYPTKIQIIKRKKSEQWYINFPSAIARAMEFKRGEVCEWIIEDKNTLVLKRVEPVETSLKKKPKTRSSKTSSKSWTTQGARSPRTGSSKERG